MPEPADLRAALASADLLPPALPAPATSRPEEELERWARSGGMALTGLADGPPSVSPAGLLPVIDDALAVLAATAEPGAPPRGVPAEQLLFGRAGLLGLRRRGRTSAGGSCRLVGHARGWAAVNLARPEDHDWVTVVAGRDVAGDPWGTLTGLLADDGPAVVDALRDLGVPAAHLRTTEPAVAAVAVHDVGPGRGPGAGRPLVVDLSAMWAGPLAARLLGTVGARIVKVELTSRPDGARAGDARFAAWLHAGHEAVALDPGSAGGRRTLDELVRRADLVIEASRPRALRHLGIDRDDVVRAGGGTWLAISGYGSGPGADWAAFGDDAAVAGGLVGRDASGQPVFCGDAIADPLAGIWAAAAGAAGLAAGGGRRIEVAMVGVAAEVASAGARSVPGGGGVVSEGRATWSLSLGGRAVPVLAPTTLVPPQGEAMAPLGRDTTRVLDELGVGAAR